MSTTYKKGTTETASRAALYARVSSDDRGNDGRNLRGQLDMCRTYAQERGWRVVAELAEDDKGASGAAFELPELNQALKMAQAGKIDILVVREMDRLSRNLAKQLIVEEELRRAGVQIQYALAEYPDTPEGRLNKHIRATIAEFEREKIIERMVRGQRNKVRSGSVRVSGCPPYGYRAVEEDGKCMLAIHEPEARIVRLVFDWYVSGDGESGPMSINAIARKLSEMNVPTYSDIHGRYRKRQCGIWGRSVISQMLRNRTYCGQWHFGKRYRDQDGHWRRNDDDHLLTVEVPAIVGPELWRAAQARLAKNRNTGSRSTKHEYLVSRRVTCGACGHKMTGSAHPSRGVDYLYYRCAATKSDSEHAHRCNVPYFPVEQVDAMVWEWIKEILTDPEALEQGLETVRQEREKENVPIRERLAVVGDLIAENRAQLERLLDLYLSGEFPREILTDRKARLESTIAALAKEQAGLLAHLEAQLLSAEQIQSIQEFAAKVGVGLDVVEYDFSKKLRLIEQLDVQATLVVKDGEKMVRARCILKPEDSDLRPVPQPAAGV